VRLSVALAGHPHPFLLRPLAQPVPVAKHGTVLGAFPEASFHEASLVLAPGEALVLYTDGLTEARSGGEFFGEARLESLLATLGERDATGIATGITDAVLSFQHDDASDDIAVLVIRAPERGAGAA
jgi:sigma-B regulation protein RsbU (phosphoserine phosphatase)